jgi:hypothetical protein
MLRTCIERVDLLMNRKQEHILHLLYILFVSGESLYPRNPIAVN